jgi:hypothetical protein
MRFLWVACPLALALTACGASSEPAVVAPSDPPPDGGNQTPDGGGQTFGVVTSGLQYEGAIATEPTGNGSRFEVSAPLFPDSRVFQRFQSVGEYEKTTASERLKLIDDDVKTFDELLRACSPTHPNITLRGPGTSAPTVAQLRTNYDEVAHCAYDQYGAKPYWVPEHVIDVDICARKLGAAWHLPTEAEILELTDSEFQMFEDTMTALPGNGLFPVQFYYRLEIYVRPTEGMLALGNLAPGTPHVSTLPVAPELMTALYIGNGKPIGLRCFRATPAE